MTGPVVWERTLFPGVQVDLDVKMKRGTVMTLVFCGKWFCGVTCEYICEVEISEAIHLISTPFSTRKN